MAEAEDVLADVARHATIYARALWDRHRKRATPTSQLTLRDVASRLDLLIVAVFDRSLPIRTAHPPAPATFLTKVFQRHDRDALAVEYCDGTVACAEIEADAYFVSSLRAVAKLR